jgi:hypothetical protein
MNEMTTATTINPKVPLGTIWIHLQSRAGKLHEMGLDENAIFTALKEFVVANCVDPNYPDAKLKALAHAAVNPDPTLEGLEPVVFFPNDDPPRPPVTDPEVLKFFIGRALNKHGALTKRQLQDACHGASSAFDDLLATMLRSGELESAGRTRHNTEKFQLADKMELTPRQQVVVEKIRALQKHTRLTGFRTTRSVNDLKASLNAEDLAAVCRVLNTDEQ